MLDHTKKPHTKVTLLFEGPADKQKEAIAALKKLGFNNAGNTPPSIPWREAFKEFEGNEPGTSLAGGRHKEGLTQVQLAKLTGIPQRHISEMERGKRPIGKKNAKLFSKALNIDYRAFL
jgi:DNA-binding XRE family transcriptional regulator